MDYLKYDWCYARLVYSNREMPAAYKLMGDALAKTGRKIVYSLCQYGREDVWKWGAQVGGNLWRTTGDILPNYQSILAVGFAQQAGLDRYAGPGHWNDPDMLEVGNGQLTEDEDRLHFTMWAMLAAPLIAGNNLTRMTPRIQAILTNREVIASIRIHSVSRATESGSRVPSTSGRAPLPTITPAWRFSIWVSLLAASPSN